MKALKFISLLMLSGLFFACNHTDRKIIKYVESVCPKGCDTCSIDLRQALKINYDTMYLFCEFTQSDEISSIMGIPYRSNKTIVDSEYRIILLKNNKIVYEDDIPSRFMAFERITERLPLHKNYFYLVHSSHYYLVRKIGSDYYYLLSEISNNTQYRIILQEGEYEFEEVTK